MPVPVLAEASTPVDWCAWIDVRNELHLMLAALVFHYPQALPWVILLEIVLTSLILFAYRKKRVVLPILRITAVTAIAFSILRPVMTRARLASERAPVVLLLDNSRSMSVVDSARPPAEWVGIAAAMGLLPAEARDKAIDAVQATCDRLSTQADELTRARAELDYAKLSGRGSELAQAALDQAVGGLQSIAHDAAAKAAVLTHANQLEKTLAYLEQIPVGIDRDTWLDHVRDKARAAAMNAEQLRFASDAGLFRTDAKIRDACLPLESQSRLELAQAAIRGLIERLGSDTSVLQFAISDRVVPYTTGSVNADGTISNLTGGVRAVLESLQTALPRAIVLFSDGRQVGGDNDAVPQGVPIYTVGIAARAGLKDLSIADVAVNSTAIVDDKVTVTAEVHALGFKGTSADLKITSGGPSDVRHLTFTDDRPMTVSFDRYFSSAGLQELTLEIDPQIGEASYKNNRAERWINVLPKGSAITNPRPATRPSTEAEMADLTGDEGRLRRLAESSGGQFFRMDQVDLLPRRLAKIQDDVGHPIEIPLWDGPYLLCIVLGCLAAEWGLRKKYGMV